MKRESENSFPQICKGITLIGLKKYEDALETLEDAKEAIYSASKAEKSMKNEENEKPRILSPVEEETRLKILRNAKGLALDAIGRHQDALKAFEGDRRLSENEKISCSEKGLVFAHCEKWREVLKAFDRILTLGPQDTPGFIHESVALIKTAGV